MVMTSLFRTVQRPIYSRDVTARYSPPLSEEHLVSHMANTAGTRFYDRRLAARSAYILRASFE